MTTVSPVRCAPFSRRARRPLGSWSRFRWFALLGATSLWSAASHAAPLTAQQEQAWRAQIKATLFVPQPLPELAPEFHGSFEPAEGVVAERVTYGTQFGLRIPAIVYRPKVPAAAKVPALIVVNGHGGDKYSWYAFYTGILYARGGAVVVTYDPAGEGERNRDRKSGTRAHDRVEPPEELGRRVGGLMVTDILQAVSYLQQRPDVDGSRIGAMGYSMGSFILSLAAAVDTRLKAAVLVGGGNLDGPEGYWDKSKPMCQGRPYRALAFLGDRPAAIYALHASRGPTLIYNGLEDTVVNIPNHGEAHFRTMRERTVQLRGRADGVFESVLVPGVSHRPFFVTKPVALWLERQLDFPRWTEAGIAQMPETHIASWATRNGVEMDRLYATEHREGGTRALGEGVPALKREALSVFSPAAWEERRATLDHDAWLRIARTRLASARGANTGSASEPRVISLRRIWDRAAHNGFTDLHRFGDRWFCALREGSGHRSDEGVVRIIASTDGETWQPTALLAEPGVDLREPKLSTLPDGRLMVVMGGTVWREGKYQGRQPRAAFSADGQAWTPPQRILAPGDWLWRITWAGDTAYGVSFIGGGGSSEPRVASLYRSRNGTEWERLGPLGVPDVSETTLRFQADGAMLALARSSTRGVGTRSGTSRPPYRNWQWREDGPSLGGPNLLLLPDGRAVAAGRVDLRELAQAGRLPASSKPIPDGPRADRTALGWITDGTFQPFLRLESDGDTGYPGMAWHKGLLWVSYYSSHEGRASVYLARVQLPAL